MRFFFSSRRRHTRFDCDWSSDVCSSDLLQEPQGRCQTDRSSDELSQFVSNTRDGAILGDVVRCKPMPAGRRPGLPVQAEDRKSGGEGKSVDLGGRRIIKKKKNKKGEKMA